MTSSLFQLANSANSYSVVLDPLTLLVQQQLTAWFNQGDYLTQLAIPFSATAGSDVWNVNAQNLQQSVLNGTYGIRLEIRSGSELGGAFGAYSATGTTGTPTIYLNGDWLTTASSEAIQAVLLEELGHSFDTILNNGADSQGDEGEFFADWVRGVSLSSDQLYAIQTENDSKVITLDGQSVAIEQAAFIPIPSNSSWQAVYLKRAGDPDKFLNNDSSDGVWTAAAADLVGNTSNPYLQVQYDTVTNPSNPSVAFKFRAEPQSGEFKALVGIFVDLDGDLSPDFTIGVSLNNNSSTGYQVDELYFIPIFTGSITDESNTRPNNTVIPKLSDGVYFNFKTNSSGNLVTGITPSKNDPTNGVDNIKVYTNTTSRLNADGLVNTSGNNIDIDGDGTPENEYVLSFTQAQMDAFRTFINGVNGASNTYKVIPTWNFGTTKIKAAGLTASNSLNAINGDIGGGSYKDDDPWKDIFGEDEPPVAVNDVRTILENDTNSLTGNLLTNDSDADGNLDRVTQFTVNGTTYTLTAAGSQTVSLFYNSVQYGSLTISSNGNYTFTRTNPDYAGTVPLVTYTVTDTTAKTATANLAIAITPVNDAPVTTDKTVTINEDNSYTFALSDFAFSDGLTDVNGGGIDGVDGLANNGTTANSFQSVMITTLPTAGTLKLNGVAVTVGQEIPTSLIPFLTFTPAPNAFDANSYATFTFQVRDNGGTVNGGLNTSSPATVTIKVNPVADTPVVVSDNATAVEAGSAPVANSGNLNVGTNPTGNVLGNDSNPDGRTNFISSVSFNGNSQNVALNTTSTSSPTVVAGTYGSLKIGSNGSYIYEVDNNNATVNGLRTSANTLTETFTYTVQDSSGLSSTTTLTVTIQGSNDSPVAVADTNIAKSPDPGSSSGDPVTGNVLNNDTDVDSVVNGETKQLVPLSATATGSTVIPVGITISSGQTVPIIVSNVNANDIQIGDLLFLGGFNGTNTKITVSNVVLNAGGTFTVTLYANPSKVPAGTSYTLGNVSGTAPNDLYFRAQNGNSGNANNSSNNAAELVLSTNIIALSSTSGIYVGMTVTGNSNIPSGTIVTGVNTNNNTITISKPVSTAITNQSLTFSIPVNSAIQGQYGSLTLNANGTYTYTPTVNIVQGDFAQDIFTYQMQDTAGAKSISTLTITIEGTATGVPDAKADTATITENAATYDANGADSTPGAGGASNPQITGGTLITGVDGTNSDNTADISVNSLTKVWLLGQTEPGTLNTSITGQYGTLSITNTTTGAYTYTLNTDATTRQILDALNEGNKLTETFNYRVSNATGTDVTTLTITINGTNDRPFATSDTGTAREASTGGTELGFNATGNLLTNDSDVDNAKANLTVTQVNGSNIPNYATAQLALTANAPSASDADGKLYVGSDGSYIYVVTNTSSTVDSLTATGSNSSLVKNFTYTVSDNNSINGKTGTANLVITIQGANDAPVNVISTNAPTVQQGQVYSFTGTNNVFSASDVDRDTTSLNTSELQTVTLSVNNGILGINPSFTIPNTVSITGNGSGVLTITATGSTTADHQLAIQQVLAQLQYQSNPFFNGTDTLTITSTDGLGLSDTDSRTINVTAPALTVSPVTVNEGSQYAVFTVDGLVNQGVTLALTAGTATLDVDYSPTFQYWNGSGWVNYTGVAVTIPNNTPNNSTSGSNTTGLLYVRVALTNDTGYESVTGGETFTLTATNSANGSVTATATIADNGTGTLFVFSGNSYTEDSTSYTPNKDDDRPLTVTGNTVLEGSDTDTGTIGTQTYSVFTIARDNSTGQNPNNSGLQLVKLNALINGTAIASGNAAIGQNDYNNALNSLQYSTDGGTTWQTYNSSTNSGYITISNNVSSIQVRVLVNNDTVAESPETFDLQVQNTGGSVLKGTATINDDELEVSSLTVNEGSTWALFTVSGTAGTNIFLDIVNGTSSISNSNQFTTNQIQYFDPINGQWLNYTGSAVPIAASNTLQVRVNISSEQEPGLDTGETFSLKATNATVPATNTTGTATIRDDGKGDLFDFNFNNPTNTSITDDTGEYALISSGSRLDDDRPLTVTPVYPSGKTHFQEAVDTHANFNITTNGNKDQQYVKLAVADITATGGLLGNPNSDYSTQIQYWGWDGTQWTWLNYTPGSFVQVPPSGTVNPYGGTALTGTVLPVRLDVFNNSPTSPTDASSETFKLIATNTGNTAYEGTTTITEAPTSNLPPRLDLDLTTPLNPNDLTDGSADYAKNFIENGNPVEFTKENSPTVDSITDPAGPDVIEFLKVSIFNQDLFNGTNEQLLIVNGTTLIAIPLNFANGIPSTSFTLSNNVTYRVNYENTDTGNDDGSLILTFSKDTGNLTKLEAETLLEAFRYQNVGEDPTAGDREFFITVKDDAFVSNEARFTATVIPVNDEPTLTGIATNPTYNENSNAVNLFSSSSVGTIEANQTLIKLTLTVSGLADGNAEKLTINGAEISLVDGTYSTTNGSVTVAVSNGTASLVFTPIPGLNTTATQSLINSLAYRHSSENPTGGDRTITITSLQDSGGVANAGDDIGNFTLASRVTVNPINDPPVLDLDATTGGGSTLNNTVIFTEMVGADTGANAVNFAKGIDLTNGNQSGTNVDDVDSPTLSNFKVGITETQIAAGDQLRFGGVIINLTTDPDTTPITGEVTYNTTAGATVFRYTLSDDGLGNRIITFISLSGSNGSNSPASLASYEALVDDLKYNNTSNTPSGSRVFSNTVTDSSEATSAPATFTVNLQPSNDSPVANPDTASVNEDTNLIVNVTDSSNPNYDPTKGLLFNDTEPENNSLTVTQFTIGGTTYNAGQTAFINGVGSLTILADGGYAFLPALNFNGSVPQATYTISDGNGGTASSTLNITVNPVNDAPSFNNSLNQTPTYTISSSSSPIVLDGSVTVIDPELSAINSGNGNWNGATLTLARDGGARSNDVFTYNGVVFGSTVSVGATQIATVTTNSNGTLVLTFNANATTDLVQQAIQNITYGYTPDSTTPPSSVKINYTLNDGNTGSQGSGGVLTDLGSITVNLTDNRPLAIDTLTVNEGSPYAVFTVDGEAGQQVKLAIAGGSATAGTDFSTSLQYWDGSSWQDYTVGSTITIPTSNDGGTTNNSSGWLYVRNAITNDTPYESGTSTETFTLTATNAVNTPSTGGTGTIKDDGTGTKFTGNIIAGSPESSTSTTGTAYLFDDDRPLTVSSPTVTEGTDAFAVFTVTGNASQWVKLALNNGTATSPSDYSATFEYSFNGTTWLTYTADTFIQIPGTQTNFQVRTVIVNDTASEPTEIFTLTASNTGGSNDNGIGTINDNDLITAPEINVTDGGFGGTTDNIADGDSTPSTGDGTDYGSTPVGTAITRTFTIQNTGTETLTLDTANITLPSGYSIVTAPSATVAPGGSTTITVQLDATAAGTYTGQIVIPNNDSDEVPYNFSLSGTVTAPSNNPPSGTDTSKTIFEDTSYTFTAADFGFSDVDGNRLAGVKITTVPTLGSLTLNDVAVTSGNTITRADIDAGNLKFIPPANANRVGTTPYTSFTFQVQDNGSGSNLDLTPNTFKLFVDPVNDAPTAQNATLAAITEDIISPPGAAVSTLFALTNGKFSDTLDQVSGGSSANTLVGMAIAGNAATADQGKWQYQSGTTWVDIPTTGLNDSAALILTAATKVRFFPTANYNGTPGSLTVRVIDNNTGTGTSFGTFTNGSTVNLNSRFTAGITGTAAVSRAVDVSTSVMPVNDPPVINQLDGDYLTYSPSSGAVVVDQPRPNSIANGIADITDVEGLKVDGYLTVTLDSIIGLTASNTTLAFKAGSPVTLSGKNVLVNGTTIGTLDSTQNGTNGQNLKITFNSNISNALATTLIQNITYQYVGAESGVVTLAFAVNDGGDGTATPSTSNALNSNIALVDINVGFSSLNSIYPGGTDIANTIYGDSNPNNLNDIVHGQGSDDYLLGKEGDDMLFGDDGNDRLEGSNGNDTLIGGGVNDLLRNTDTLKGDAGNDLLFGVGGNDSLYGGTGNDTLDGGTGDDYMQGDQDDDTYIVDASGDRVSEPANSGNDTVWASVAYTLPSNVEGLVLTGTPAINATGNELSNTLTGNSAKNQLTGGLGNDVFDYRVLTNSLVANYDSITDFRNTLTEQDKILVSTAIVGLSNSLTVNSLTATDIGNVLTTNNFGTNYAAVLTLNGTTQTFLALNDGTAGYQEALDAIIEITGYNGMPTMESFSRILKGSDPSDATRGMSDSINGTTGNDTLLGYGGHDTLLGGDGNDYLDGGDGNDYLDGGAGNDTLIGGAGNNTLIGGPGDDLYVVTSATDVITELAGGGTDTVQASFTYSLASLTNVENLTLLGTSNINGTGNTLANIITGNSGNSSLDGGSGNDTLLGGDGNDTLLGGVGNDSLLGGSGDDLCLVDSTSDVVVENANAGTDTVLASVTYTLAANVENLTIQGTTNLNGTGNDLDNILTGNGGNNSLSGGNGNDTLLGGAGNDTLSGGTGTNSLVGGIGDDVYVVDVTTNAISERVNEGTDTVRVNVSFSLADNVENLVLLGTTAINGTGNLLNNLITGNTGNNSLVGGDGNDSLDGSSGLDTLIGGNGNDLLAGGVGADFLTGGAEIDRFDYRTLNHSVLGSTTAPGYDQITDFVAGTDLIVTTTARAGFVNAGNINTTTYTTLNSTGAIASVLTTSNFTANVAALFIYGSRSFIALNNATAGYSASASSLIEVTGYTGTFTLNSFTTTLG